MAKRVEKQLNIERLIAFEKEQKRKGNHKPKSVKEIDDIINKVFTPKGEKIIGFNFLANGLKNKEKGQSQSS